MAIFHCFNVLKKCKRLTISVAERAIIPYSTEVHGLAASAYCEIFSNSE